MRVTRKECSLLFALTESHLKPMSAAAPRQQIHPPEHCRQKAPGTPEPTATSARWRRKQKQNKSRKQKRSHTQTGCWGQTRLYEKPRKGLKKVGAATQALRLRLQWVEGLTEAPGCLGGPGVEGQEPGQVNECPVPGSPGPGGWGQLVWTTL